MNFEDNQLNEENQLFKLIKIKLGDNKLVEKAKILTKNNKNTFNENSIIFFFKNIIEYIILGIPFIFMDYFIRKETQKINFIVSQKYSYIYSYTYIIFFIFSSKSFKGNIGKIYYCVIFLFYFLFFITNIIFFSFTSNFFHFKLLSYAGEGSHYLFGVILGTKKKIWINILIIFFSFVLAFIIFRKSKTNKLSIFVCFFIIFFFSQNYIKNLLGPIGKKKWDDFNNPINIFNEFTQPNKCMKIVGFYKYIQMDFCKTYLNFNVFRRKKEKEELEFLNKIYKDLKNHSENEYTGIFKDKNLIFVQLEGMDTWLLNKNYTPTLYSLKKNAFVFNEHYSYKMSGGATFNSEFCVNTGFYSPISLSGNSYDFYKNTFNSIPKMFKKLGYILKCFHFNNPDFYNRYLNYLGWGYDKFLSLIKTKKYKKCSLAGLDTELIKNKIFYDEIFNTKGKFLYYFITFSIHLPFKNSYHSHYILQNKFGNKIPETLKEDDVAKILAGETDKMVQLLLKGLKKHNLYNNTIILFYADHSTFFEHKILSKYKITYDHRIDHTPFFIWSANMRGKSINKASCQLDILPTVLNLFGIPFQEKTMIGRDIFDKNNSGLAFFDDYSWIDGKILINNGKIVKLKKISDNEIDKKYILNNQISKLNHFV
jgi:phosphoglycerol transferase MdoB-like AlkP superfamily enzyme